MSLTPTDAAERAELVEDQLDRHLLALEPLGDGVPDHGVLEVDWLMRLRSDFLRSFISEKTRSHLEVSGGMSSAMTTSLSTRE